MKKILQLHDELPILIKDKFKATFFNLEQIHGQIIIKIVLSILCYEVGRD